VLAAPLDALGNQAASLIRESLVGLAPVLCALLNTIDKVASKDSRRKEAA
jgi:hypothetical protein